MSKPGNEKGAAHTLQDKNSREARAGCSRGAEAPFFSPRARLARLPVEENVLGLDIAMYVVFVVEVAQSPQNLQDDQMRDVGESRRHTRKKITATRDAQSMRINGTLRQITR